MKQKPINHHPITHLNRSHPHSQVLLVSPLPAGSQLTHCSRAASEELSMGEERSRQFC